MLMADGEEILNEQFCRPKIEPAGSSLPRPAIKIGT